MNSNRSSSGSRRLFARLAVALIGTALMAPQVAAQGDTWESKAPMPSAQLAPAAGAINGKLYVAGGNPATCTSTASLSVYDPNTNAWTGAAAMPAARHSAGAAVIDGKLYIAGGSSSPCFDPAQSTLFRYDPATNTWATLASSAAARVNLRMEVIDGKLYALGTGAFGGPNFEMYDPLTDSWTPKASFPTGDISGAAVGVINNKLYVAGGCCASLDGLWAYDPLTDSWAGLASMPSGRNLAVGGVLDGILYVAGGTDVGAGIRTNTLFAYDPTTTSWSTKAPMAFARDYHAGAVLGGKFYAMGGTPTGAFAIASMEAYTSTVLNQPPVADAGADQTVIAGEAVTLDGSGSSDPDGTITSYAWDFGDSTTGSGSSVTKTFADAGVYTVVLTVTDDDGATADDSATVTVLSDEQAIQSLASIVQSFNLQQGIANSLDAKIQNAVDALSAANAGQRSDAANKIIAFINSVNAQRGTKLTDSQADTLVALAQRILAVL